MYRILIIIYLLSLIPGLSLLQAQEAPEAIEAYRNEPYGNAQYKKKGIMDGNLVRTMYFNQAEVGRWGPEKPTR